VIVYQVRAAIAKRVRAGGALDNLETLVTGKTIPRLLRGEDFD